MKFTITLFAFVISISAWAMDCSPEHYIVSDYDDTIKTYKTHSLVNKVGYALWSKKINAGFSVLINEMVQSSLIGPIETCENDLFTVLSASPKIIKWSIKKLLKKNKFPKREIILKSIGKETFDYKVKSLEKVLNRNNAPLILIGDDTSHDHEAYNKIKELYPDRVTAMYIHNIKNRNLPSGQKSYLTAFDIALHEYLDGRLSAQSVILVGNKVLSEKDKYIIPRYGHCPEYVHQLEDATIPEAIKDIQIMIQKRIEGICKNRKWFVKYI